MHDDLALPTFLDRKTNGFVTQPPAPVRAKRAPRAKKLPADAVKIYVTNRAHGLACGYHHVQVLSKGRKFVRVRKIGKSRGMKLTLNEWERIVC